MKACKCGSFAINNDPSKMLCDVCYAYDLGKRDENNRIFEMLQKILPSGMYELVYDKDMEPKK
jgi:hypothetical protein